jgi:flagellar protein FlaG
MTSPIELSASRPERVAELRLDRDSPSPLATIPGEATFDSAASSRNTTAAARRDEERPRDETKDLLDELRRAGTSQNARLAEANQRMQISIDESTGNIVVEVRNTVTGEVLRQIPTEEALRIARNIDQQTDMLTGVVVDRYE